MVRPALIVALGCWSLPVRTPDLILINGRVFTGAPQQPLTEALAITGQRISAIGASRRYRAWPRQRRRSSICKAGS